MPELPEVETVMRGISPFLEGATIKKIKLNRADLRWPFPENFASRVKQAKVLHLKRRSKYMIIQHKIHIISYHLSIQYMYNIQISSACAASVDVYTNLHK